MIGTLRQLVLAMYSEGTRHPGVAGPLGSLVLCMVIVTRGDRTWSFSGPCLSNCSRAAQTDKAGGLCLDTKPLTLWS
jgi:hypothetical protein